MEPAAEILVDSPDVVYSPETIEARYEYRTTRVSREGGVLRVRAGRGRRRTLGTRGPATHSQLFLRCSPGLRVSPSAPPGRCPDSGSCWSAGAGTTAPRSLLLFWPIGCA